jgi:hypothetical protein
MPCRYSFLAVGPLFLLAAAALAVDSMYGQKSAAPKAAGVTIYDPDPQHLLNRLHRAMAVRTIDGVDYGTDNAVPFINDADNLLSGEAHVQLLSVLDEFVRTQTPDRLPSELPRALLQHEAWTTFDHTLLRTHDELPAQRKALRARLAKIIALLALKDSDIARLPDNYADAVKSGAFPRDFDPANPDKTFLPGDLFDSKGPWVEISDDRGQSVAPVHVQSLQGRSIFRIFIRCPGERKETLAYMQKLNLHTTPWALEPAMIATTHLGNEIRWDPLRMDRKTPQFPEGTMIALVRQMVLIDDKLQLRSSRITQSIQLRVFRSIGEGFILSEPEQAKAQAFFELNMRRGELLAGKAGGLHAVAKDDVEYQLFPIGGGNNETRESHLRGSAGMKACVTCHSANGIFSVRTYARGTNPQLFPAPHSDHSTEHSLSRKRERFDWGVLRGMLEAEQMNRQ